MNDAIMTLGTIACWAVIAGLAIAACGRARDAVVGRRFSRTYRRQF